MDLDVEEPAMDLGDEEDAMMEGSDLSSMGGNKDNTFTKTDANIVPKSGKLAEGDEEEDEEVLDEVDLVDEADLVSEVTRRVADRLRTILKKNK